MRGGTYVLLSLALGLVAGVSADLQSAAPGIATYCNYADPAYAALGFTRVNFTSLGAKVCNTMQGFSNTNPDYTGCAVR